MVNYEQEKKNLENIGKYLDKIKVAYNFVDLETSEGDAFPAIFSSYKYRDFTFNLHIINNDDWICIKCFLLDANELDPDIACAVYRAGMELNFELPETTFSSNDGLIYLEADMNVGVDYDEFKREWDALNVGLDYITEDLAPQKVEFSGIEEEKPKKPVAKKKAAKKGKKKTAKKGKKKKKSK